MGTTVTMEVTGLDTAIRVIRFGPSAVRAAMRTRVADEVVSPVAHEVMAVAATESNHLVNQFGSRGVTVRKGEKPVLVVGGTSGVGTHGGNLRAIVHGAEFGGSNARHLYARRSGKGGSVVKRRTTVEFGTTGQFRETGRFIYPTITALMPQIIERYKRIVLDALEASRRGA